MRLRGVRGGFVFRAQGGAYGEGRRGSKRVIDFCWRRNKRPKGLIGRRNEGPNVFMQEATGGQRSLREKDKGLRAPKGVCREKP